RPASTSTLLPELGLSHRSALSGTTSDEELPQLSQSGKRLFDQLLQLTSRRLIKRDALAHLPMQQPIRGAVGVQLQIRLTARAKDRVGTLHRSVHAIAVLLDRSHLADSRHRVFLSCALWVGGSDEKACLASLVTVRGGAMRR